MKKKDFLTLQDYSAKDLWSLLEATKNFKNSAAESKNFKPLTGKHVVLLFQKASTRTRVSFEVAIDELGGHAICLGWAEAHLGRGEAIADTARVLSRYVDCVVARVYKQSDLEEMAKHAAIPVINALSDLYHPCQAVADLFTFWEKRGVLKGLKVTYVGDGNNVCNSLLIGCSKMGVDISVACPPSYEPYSKALQSAKKASAQAGSKVKIVREPVEAIKDADIVYTDTFVSMGDEAEHETRLKAFVPKYRVTADLLKHASKNVLFMHCLPAHRNEEVTDEVMDGAHSVIWDQAENRLHTTKAILAKIII